MTHTITINGKEFQAFAWQEVAPAPEGADIPMRHARNETLLANGVRELAPGEVAFRSDLTFVFDTLLELKGDGRKFVIIASANGEHIAKPY